MLSVKNYCRQFAVKELISWIIFGENIKIIRFANEFVIGVSQESCNAHLDYFVFLSDLLVFVIADFSGVQDAIAFGIQSCKF